MKMPKSEQCTLFNQFHDGSFGLFQRSGNDILFQIDIQYLAERIETAYTHFKGIFMNCQYYTYEFWNGDYADSEDVNRMQEILDNIEILSAEEDGECVSLTCHSHKQNGGTFRFACDAILLFDEGGKAITSGELEEISRQYWHEFTA
jgi:hypothetical protein